MKEGSELEYPVNVSSQMINKLNFAMQQNYVPVFRNIVVRNDSQKTYENVRINISFTPEFAAAVHETIPLLEPEKPVEISPVRIVVSPDFLYSLTEKMNCVAHIEAVCGDELLFAEDRDIELFAYDQWLGVLIMPELTAAFITPNHPRIAELAAKASMYLKKWTGDPSFTGYQTRNPNIVKKQAAALYAALQEENIAYTMPPASFESFGQRVRLPYAVLEQKCGTCIDLSLLFAACAESVGLHPLVVFINGHAFAGVWLEEETFPESVEDDVSALTKRIASGIDAVCLLECTDFTAGKKTDFDLAVKHANDNLLDVSEFQFALDITRCRCSGIRPMPVRISENGVFTAIDYGKRDKKEITSAPGEIDLSIHGIVSSEPTDVTRQTIWERKLLDINLKNSLLNFRPSSSNIQFMTADLSVLEDHISGGEDFKIMPVPQDITLSMSDSRIFEIENEVDLITAIADAEFKNKRLRTFLSPTELERILKKLHRQSKVSIEENGANTLYLALGLLRWFETDKSDRPRYAPLVLVPVDIIRKIQDRSYSLRIRDEETQMNITLIEMLRQNYGINISGLNPLPLDDSGVDLPLVFNTVRNAVMSRKRWDIIETAFLGQFSFSRFIMWNDIRSRSDELAQNKVVASIMSGKLEWQPDGVEYSPAELDEKVLPSEMAVPLSCDSSQLSAIYAAAKGESFVLHGPPGTGKSQTITNMIANALYNGKSVLFVAEKMAALSVVQKRLESIGLAPFCLELHSNKTQKRAVLSQLDSALAASRIKAPEEFEKTAEQLNALRRELNDIMSDIHSVRSIGMSFYDAVTEYDRLSDVKNMTSVSEEFVRNTDKYKYEKCCDVISGIAVAGKECGGYADSPLKDYRNKEYSLEIKDGFKAAAEEYKSAVKAAADGFGRLTVQLGIPFGGSQRDHSALYSIMSTAANNEYLPEAFTGDTVVTERSAIDKLLSEGKEFSALNGELSEKFESTVFSADPVQAKLDWKRCQQKWFLPKLLGKRKMLKEMALHSKSPDLVTEQNFLEICDRLEKYAALKKEILSCPQNVTAVFGALWNGENSQFVRLEEMLHASDSIRNNISVLSTGRAEVTELLKRLPSDVQLKTAVNDYGIMHDRLAAAENRLSEQYKTDMSEIYSADNMFEIAAAKADGWLGGTDLLRERTNLETLMDEARELGIGEVIDDYTAGRLTEENISAAFVCAVCRGVISASFAESPQLSSFQGSQFDAKLEKYRQVSDKFSRLTVQELAARLSARVPDTSSGISAGSSELSVLQKAIRSGGRMLPIRKLFDSIPNLLRRICPCMLMSPISVAQYIDPSFPKFDLVIFDEASQLPTSEAVGAIARGENVIVVGDPKQLPPTSFFTSNQIDEENYDKEDLESVLDDCLALGMPQKHLLWHYRSRHESLIAFSNAKFYENKLLTFPSPADIVSEVKWVNVDGFYDKGKTKQNKAEAEAVIAEIIRRLKDEKLRKQSIGVVTFSLVQQNLIDDMLAEAFINDPQLEQFANDMYEPIFIKNLENVQGDERDVILFSIGYGPDNDGRVSMNFGPVNRDGGWRRLNVAVSRARREMIVFSVIRPEQIDLSRTRSEGVAQLKAFLEYAAKGRSALAAGSGTAHSDRESFAQAVADEINKLGYTAKCGIGCSGYKIDVGVINPDKPSEYIMAVMCDSRNNASATTSRDRNILQPQVLKGLGWNVCSVHAPDWLDNKQKTAERLKAEIDAAVERYRSAPDEKVCEAPKTSFAVEFQREEAERIEDKCERYASVQLVTMGTAESFYEPQSLKAVADCISRVVEAEAPVSRKYTEKKVIAAWGITRTGSRVDKVFDSALSLAKVRVTLSNGSDFYWNKSQDPESYSACRIPDGGEKRSLDDICARELSNGIMLIMNTQIAMARSDLVRETAKLFGFSRTGGTIEQSVAAGIEYACEHGLITVGEDGKITLNE